MAFAGEHLHNGIPKGRLLMRGEKKVCSLVLLFCYSRHAGGAVSKVEMTTCSCKKRKEKQGNKLEAGTKTERKRKL